MSLFDPYSLYHRKYRKTHKGQVIQQKPTDYKTPILQEEIPRSLSVLKTFNYIIYSPLTPDYPSLEVNLSTNITLTKQLSSNIVTSLVSLSDIYDSLIDDFIQQVQNYNFRFINIILALDNVFMTTTPSSSDTVVTWESDNFENTFYFNFSLQNTPYYIYTNARDSDRSYFIFTISNAHLGSSYQIQQLPYPTIFGTNDSELNNLEYYLQPNYEQYNPSLVNVLSDKDISLTISGTARLIFIGNLDISKL